MLGESDMDRFWPDWRSSAVGSADQHDSVDVHSRQGIARNALESHAGPRGDARPREEATIDPFASSQFLCCYELVVPKYFSRARRPSQPSQFRLLPRLTCRRPVALRGPSPRLACYPWRSGSQYFPAGCRPGSRSSSSVIETSPYQVDRNAPGIVARDVRPRC